MNNSRFLFSIATLLIVTFIGKYNFAQDTVNLEQVERATVFIMQTQNINQDLVVHCVSTGTIVNRSGLILTNAHSVVQSSDCAGDTIVIALNVNIGDAPVPRFRAVIAQADIGLDLAILRITHQFDGRLVEPGSLSLPFVELADSGNSLLDQTLTIVGYPGIGNEAISSMRTTISGFIAEPSGGDKTWIQSGLSIPGTMSGGGAYDGDGRLIGIPTTAPITSTTNNSSCVTIQDTNSDQVVNEADVCIPIGGEINSLRPANFAQPLVLGAELGIEVDLSLPQDFETTPAAQPNFRRLFFSTSVNEAGMPTSVIHRLPAGSNSLYLFFDYENTTPESVYELRVTTDGIPNNILSLPPVRWSGGKSGIWYIGNTGQPLPNGVYEFTLLANGFALDTARIVIGGSTDSIATFSDIVFGLLDTRGNVLGNGFVLPGGTIATARFIFREMIEGTQWSAIWYYEGNEVFRSNDSWLDGTNGSKTISIQDPNGLRPGTYRLELYIDSNLSATSDFTLAGAQAGVFPVIFDDMRFVSALSSDVAVNAPASTSFSNTIDRVYALFDWEQIGANTLWSLRWTIDGSTFFQRTLPWSNDLRGENFLIELASETTLPDGTYRLDLIVNNVQLVSEEFQVGIGQLSIDRFAQSVGIQVRGQILDSETGDGIPSVTFILLGEEFSVEDFVWDQSQIFAMATTDRNGDFLINRLLETDVPYSVIIASQGYLSITADGILLTDETENPLTLTIYMSKD